MEAPVAVEVAVGLDRAELQDGLGAGQAPAGAADVQAVADQVPTRSLDHPDGDRPAAGQRGVLAEELLFGLEVADAGVDTAVLAWAARPDRMLIAWVATHASAWGSPSAWKPQAAFHKYSRTWMRSTRMWTATPRRAASAATRSSWWRAPSTSTTQVRRWEG